MPFEPLKVDIDPVFHGQLNKTAEPKAGSGVAGVLNNQEYTPSVSETQQALDEINHNDKKSLVRTYKDDIASAIQANHLSSINIAIAENEKMHSQIAGDMAGKESEDQSGSRSKLVITLSIILVVIAVLAVAITYFIQKKDTAPTTTETPIAVPILSADYKDEFSTNTIVKGRFNSALSSRLNDLKVPAGSIYSPYITVGTSSSKRLATANEFISLAEFNTPDIVKRALTTDFMAGMYAYDQNQPFVVFKTTSFENTYAGMLEWELNLEKDFTKLFRLNGGNEIGGTIALLSASSTHKFQDGVVSNQDVRLLRDASGKIMFIYNILNKDTVIITTGDQALKELILRINKEKGAKR
jgi:hypothetical protein